MVESGFERYQGQKGFPRHKRQKKCDYSNNPNNRYPNSFVSEVRRGFAPLNNGFADRCVTTSPPHQNQVYFLEHSPFGMNENKCSIANIQNPVRTGTFFIYCTNPAKHFRSDTSHKKISGFLEHSCYSSWERHNSFFFVKNNDLKKAELIYMFYILLNLKIKNFALIYCTKKVF